MNEELQKRAGKLRRWTEMKEFGKKGNQNEVQLNSVEITQEFCPLLHSPDPYINYQLITNFQTFQSYSPTWPSGWESVSSIWKFAAELLLSSCAFVAELIPSKSVVFGITLCLFLLPISRLPSFWLHAFNWLHDKIFLDLCNCWPSCVSIFVRCLDLDDIHFFFLGLKFGGVWCRRWKNKLYYSFTVILCTASIWLLRHSSLYC